MKAKCISGFSIEKCDEDGFTIDGEYISIEEGTEWNIKDDDYKIEDREIRLTSNEKDDYTWLELPKETFEECFTIIED